MRHTKLFTAGLMAAVTITLLAGTPAAAADPTPVQARAQTDIKENAGGITKLAYVTSKKHTKTEYVEGTAYRDGTFDLTYKFHYRDSDNDPQTYTLKFSFTAKGAVDKVTTVSHSSFWPPFNALAMTDAILKELSK